MPVVSVVIPVYNRAHLIAQTLASLVAQTFNDFEIIIVDDGSSDDVEGAVEPYRGRVRLLRTENRGPGAARNLGAQQAVGSYLAFLDSDDVWFPWSLEIYAEALRKFAGPAIILGSTVNFEHLSELTRILRSASEFEAFTDYCATAKADIFRGSGVMVIRRDLFLRKGGFSEDQLYSEDLDFLLRCGDSGPVVTVLKPTMLGRRSHSESSVAEMHRTFAGMRHLLRQEELAVYPGGAKRRWDRRRLLCLQARAVSNWCLKARMKREAMQIYRQTFCWQLRLGQIGHLIKIPVLAAFPFLRWIRRSFSGRTPSSLENADSQKRE